MAPLVEFVKRGYPSREPPAPPPGSHTDNPVHPERYPGNGLRARDMP
jgi:hypothetical protein